MRREGTDEHFVCAYPACVAFPSESNAAALKHVVSGLVRVVHVSWFVGLYEEMILEL